MSAETFTTALFLITAVVAAGVLINAIFPVVYQMSSTFSSSSHDADQRIRTDVKIVTTYADATHALVWLKNTGSNRILKADIEHGDVITGPAGNFDRLAFVTDNPPAAGQWNGTLSDTTSNIYWDTGETLKIDAYWEAGKVPGSGESIYFQFILPNGVTRSETFTRS